MSHTNHPDFLKYQEDIISILDSDFLIKNNSCSISYDKAPKLLEEKFYEHNHHKLKSYIGTKHKSLKVLGFHHGDNFSKGNLMFACECDCGLFCVVNNKIIRSPQPTTYVCCPECKNEIFSFGEAFGKKTGKRLSIEALLSIFNLHNGQPIKDFIVGPYIDYNDNEFNPFANLELEEFKSLLDANSDKSKFWTIENGVLKSIKGNKKIESCELTPHNVYSLNELKDAPKTLTSSIGKKVFRVRILGIYKNPNVINSKNNSLACQCDCGLYTTINFDKLIPTRLPSCGRCEQVVQNYIANKSKKSIIIDRKQAWEELGFITKHVPSQIADLRSNKHNTYVNTNEIESFESTDEKFKPLIGKKYGLITPISVSKNLKTNKNSELMICKCDCGSECLFSFDTLSNKNKFRFLACSSCCSIIQETIRFSIDPENGTDALKVFNAWEKYLKFHNLKARSITKTFRDFLKIRRDNPYATFKAITLEKLK